MSIDPMKALVKSLGEIVGGRLECETCKKSVPISREDCAQYLQRGWPQCCGYTMTFLPARSPEPEK